MGSSDRRQRRKLKIGEFIDERSIKSNLHGISVDRRCTADAVDILDRAKESPPLRPKLLLDSTSESDLYSFELCHRSISKRKSRCQSEEKPWDLKHDWMEHFTTNWCIGS